MLTPFAAKLITAISLVLVICSGMWLMKYGRPYNGFITTVHKLVSIAYAVYLFIYLRHYRNSSPITGWETAVIDIALLLFVGTVASGGVLTIERPVPSYVTILHKLTSSLAICATVVTLFALMMK